MKQEEKTKVHIPDWLIRDWDNMVRAANMLKKGTGKIVTKNGTRYVEPNRRR